MAADSEFGVLQVRSIAVYEIKSSHHGNMTQGNIGP